MFGRPRFEPAGGDRVLRDCPREIRIELAVAGLKPRKRTTEVSGGHFYFDRQPARRPRYFFGRRIHERDRVHPASGGVTPVLGVPLSDWNRDDAGTKMGVEDQGHIELPVAGFERQELAVFGVE